MQYAGSNVELWVFAMFSYNGCLCIYYACVIAIQMKEKNIRKYVEPFLHGLPILMGLAYSIPGLFLGLYSQSGRWCVPDVPSCSDKACRRMMDVSLAFALFLSFVTIVLPLGMVIAKVVITGKALERMYKQTKRTDTDESIKDIMDKQNNTSVIGMQAMAYFAAFLLTLIFPVLEVSGSMNREDAKALKMVFLPFQGFFNCVIFIGHKIYNYRRVNPHATVCFIIGQLFCTRWEEPLFLSRISIVFDHQHSGENDVVNRVGRIMVTDEKDNSVSYISNNVSFGSRSNKQSSSGLSFAPGTETPSVMYDGKGEKFADDSDSKGGLSAFEISIFDPCSEGISFDDDRPPSEHDYIGTYCT